MGHYFDKLVNVIAALRDPEGGCPWDLEQTHKTLRPYLIEECYEMLYALDSENSDLLKEEMGDVLLQVLLHSQIAAENREFSIEDVCHTLSDKIVRRHPHVFHNEQKEKPSLDQLDDQWQEIKEKEGKKKEVLPKSDLFNPSLFSAYKIGKRTEKINFDWSEIKEVIGKVKEELSELEEKIALETKEKSAHFDNSIEEELGDLMFTVAQLARHLGHNPELTLGRANKKFHTRFIKMLELVKRDQADFEKLSSEEKETYWIKVKEHEKSNPQS